jgi:RNA polymerase sigma factor (sigma-70 family)
MSREYKTSKKKRTSYIYYSPDGKKIIELMPGEHSVTEADIALLHTMDDAEVDEQRRYKYRTTPNLRPKKNKKTKKATDKLLSDGNSGSDHTLITDSSSKKCSTSMKLDSPRTFDDVIALKKRPYTYADFKSDPLQLLLSEMDKAEHNERLHTLVEAMDNLTPAQRDLYDKVYVQRRTNTDIASEEGVTETAIRNRLKKLHDKLRKFFP